jgi:hypothetical protein
LLFASSSFVAHLFFLLLASRRRDELEASQPARSYGGGDEGGVGGAEGGFDSAAGVEGQSVTLSDMRDGANFHVHVVTDGVCADLETVSEQMKALGASIDDGSFVAESAAAAPAVAASSDAGEEEATPESTPEAEAEAAAPSAAAAAAALKKGSYVAAPFDGAWYRAKVRLFFISFFCFNSLFLTSLFNSFAFLLFVSILTVPREGAPAERRG